MSEVTPTSDISALGLAGEAGLFAGRLQADLGVDIVPDELPVMTSSVWALPPRVRFCFYRRRPRGARESEVE